MSPDGEQENGAEPQDTLTDGDPMSDDVQSDVFSSVPEDDGHERSVASPPPLSSNAAFPAFQRTALLKDEGSERRRAAVGGVLAACISSVAISLASPTGSMLHKMFDLQNIATLIPVGISALFFWGMLSCWSRWRRVKALEKVSSKSLLVDATRILSVDGLAELRGQLEDSRFSVSPLVRRLQAVVEQWQTKPDLQDADLVLQQHAVHDEESMHSSYALLHTFVWALPVLGLIGTVIGISLAVGGFAEFLGGSIDDVGAIKQNLVGVTGGLSFAFLITLQGLLTSLILMLFTSTSETREGRLYADIQKDIGDTFLAALQRYAPTRDETTRDREIQAWREMLAEATAGILSGMRTDATRIVETIAAGMDVRHKTYVDEVREWTAALRKEIAEAAGKLTSAAGSLGQEMSRSGEDFLVRVGAVRGALTDQTTQFLSATEERSRATSSLQAEITGLVSTQTEAAKDGTHALTRLAEVTRDVLAGQGTLQASLQALTDSRLDSSFDDLGKALTVQSGRLQETTTAIASLAGATGEILTAQESLVVATAALREADFLRSLTSLQEALVAIAPILAGFREPFVLRAVPVQSSLGGPDGR